MSGPRLVHLPAAMDKAESLDVIDKLRAKIESGEVVCFIGVTIEPDDSVEMWSASTTRVSRLRSMGAVSHLLACLHAGEA